MDQLGITPALDADVPPPRPDLKLHDLENALEDVTAALFWSGEYIRQLIVTKRRTLNFSGTHLHVYRSGCSERPSLRLSAWIGFKTTRESFPRTIHIHHLGKYSIDIAEYPTSASGCSFIHLMCVKPVHL